MRLLDCIPHGLLVHQKQVGVVKGELEDLRGVSDFVGDDARLEGKI